MHYSSERKCFGFSVSVFICSLSDVTLTRLSVCLWCRRPAINAEICNSGTSAEVASHVQPDDLLHSPSAHAAGTLAIPPENHDNHLMTACWCQRQARPSPTARHGTGSSAVTRRQRPRTTEGAIPLQSRSP